MHVISVCQATSNSGGPRNLIHWHPYQESWIDDLEFVVVEAIVVIAIVIAIVVMEFRAYLLREDCVCGQEHREDLVYSFATRMVLFFNRINLQDTGP